jgi:hypothetical protein
VGSPQFVEMLELEWSELSVRVVCDAGQVVRPYVCNALNILRTNLDVVSVDQEKQFSELAHHGEGLRGEMREDADNKLVVLVNKMTSSFELREERLDGDTHCLQLLEGYVLLDVRHPPKPRASTHSFSTAPHP